MELTDFKDYYKHLNTNQLYLPEEIRYTHFRFFCPRPVKIPKILKTKRDVKKILEAYSPMHAFYIPSYFLQPNEVGERGNDEACFLSSIELVLDIDRKDEDKTWEENLNDAKIDTSRLINSIQDLYELSPKLIVYSGCKGFHIHYDIKNLIPPDSFWLKFDRREDSSIQLKKKMVREIVARTGIRLDEPATWNTRGLMRIPGTIHGGTGALVEVIKRSQIRNYHPKIIVNVSQYVRKHGDAKELEKMVLGGLL
jgi:hypothetical protein